MRGSSSGMWSSARSESALLAELPAPIEIRPVRSARRLRLRYDEGRGVLKLTCPMRTSRRSALAWALDQREWIEAQLARSLPGEPFVPGATIPIRGRERQPARSQRRRRRNALGQLLVRGADSLELAADSRSAGSAALCRGARG